MGKVKTKSLASRITACVLLSILACIGVVAVVIGVKYLINSGDSYIYRRYSVSDMTDNFASKVYKDAPYIVIDDDATELKIMQLADPQIKWGSFPERDIRTMNSIAKALDEQKPDIVVCTGDLTCSISTYDAYKYFADFMEDRHQYWALAYGNHDSQFDCSKATLYNLLKDYKYFLYESSPSTEDGHVYGESNYFINVFKGEKKDENLAYALVIMDSNLYPEGADGLAWVYDYIHEDQVEWYGNVIKGLQSINADIKTSLFFHMPTREWSDLYYACMLKGDVEDPNGLSVPTSVTSYLQNKIDANAVQYISGSICENPKDATEIVELGIEGYSLTDEQKYTVGVFYQGEIQEYGKETKIFAKVKELGSTTAMFCGHDHVNNFKGVYDGITLCYGLCAGYHTYPFFDSFISDEIYFNGQLWSDRAGQEMDKGVTMAVVDLTDVNRPIALTDIMFKDIK